MNLDLLQLFRAALRRFLEHERELIRRGVAERALCARLAMYLQDAAGAAGLQGYWADTEYNRNGPWIKTVVDDGAVELTIVADLLLHSRGAVLARDNLIAVEMKKSTGTRRAKDDDRKRLRLMTRPGYHGMHPLQAGELPRHVYGYELGIYLELDIRRMTCLCEEYRGGELVDSVNEDF